MTSQVTWQGQRLHVCPGRPNRAENTTRVYTGCDGVMVPIITEAERRSSCRDNDQSRWLPPQRQEVQSLLLPRKAADPDKP